MAQARGDVAGGHQRLVVLHFSALHIGEGALHGLRAANAHELGALRGLAFVLHNHQRGPNVGGRRAHTVEDLDVALIGHVIAQQNAAPDRARNLVIRNGLGNLGAGGEHVTGGQRYAHIGVCGHLVDDDVGIQQRVSAACLHGRMQLADAHLAARAGHFGHIVKNLVALAPLHHLPGGAATAFGHVVHHFGLEQLDVAVLNGHCVLSRFKQSTVAAWRRKGGCWQAAQGG